MIVNVCLLFLSYENDCDFFFISCATLHDTSDKEKSMDHYQEAKNQRKENVQIFAKMNNFLLCTPRLKQTLPFFPLSTIKDEEGKTKTAIFAEFAELFDHKIKSLVFNIADSTHTLIIIV